MAIRAASIWRSVIQAGSRHLSPYSPKLISLPRVATPVMRPRICFRCLTFFGINIAFSLYFRLPIADGRFENWQLEIKNWQSTVGYLPSVFYRPSRLRARGVYAA